MKWRKPILIAGPVLFVVLWWLLVEIFHPRPDILPSPLRVLLSLPRLHTEDYIVRNIFRSLRLNGLAYLEAIAISIPLGFAIGLYPVFRYLSNAILSALRYLPIPPMVAFFMTIFHLGLMMKVQFLTYAVSIFTILSVIQRIDEVDEIYMQTFHTLGAKPFYTIRRLFTPVVLANVWGDLTVILPITWGWITYVETINSKEGGIGTIMVALGYQGQMDKVIMSLIIVALFGFCLDRGMRLVGSWLFPFKFARRPS